MRKLNFGFQAPGVFIALLLLCLLFALASPHFVTTENIFSVIRSFSFVAIIAMIFLPHGLLGRPDVEKV
jgi:ribose/xylose/arabinose/galactoside ABC-type transport system permease subunit